MTSLERATKLREALEARERGQLWGTHFYPEVDAMIAVVLDAHAEAALAVGGIPGVQLTPEQVREIADSYERARIASEKTLADRLASASSQAHASVYIRAAKDVATLLSDRAHLMAMLSDLVQDGRKDIWDAGYQRGREDAAKAVAACATPPVRPFPLPKDCCWQCGHQFLLVGDVNVCPCDLTVERGDLIDADTDFAWVV